MHRVVTTTSLVAEENCFIQETPSAWLPHFQMFPGSLAVSLCPSLMAFNRGGAATLCHL